MDAEPESSLPAPILVLGVGNRLLRDDGVGLEILRSLQATHGHAPRVEFVDGGTQGLALLGQLDDRRAVLVLDAVGSRDGSPRPGMVHDLDASASGGVRATSAHGSSVAELLSVARLLGHAPGCIRVVGIEPEEVRTGIGLSGRVAESLPEAIRVAGLRLGEMIAHERQAGEVAHG